MSLQPKTTPKQSLEETEKILQANNVKDTVCLVGIRGYYKNSMGKKGENDRGIYDDAIFLVAPECFMAFNANTDPSLFRKAIANLKPGLWKYKIGIHGLSKPKEKRYKALVQAAKVKIHRDQVGEETGFFGINIHRGSKNSTSSLGCQTIPPEQWPSFIATVEAQLKKHGQQVIPYLLVESV